jgi:hypothetical protein
MLSDPALALTEALAAEALSIQPRTVERRRHSRYELELELKYTVLKGPAPQDGVGKTRNVSVGGACFLADQGLPAGLLVDLSIDWPVLLDGICHLQLRMLGLILRSAEGEIAIRAMHHEFRTRRSPSTAYRVCGFGSIISPL